MLLISQGTWQLFAMPPFPWANGWFLNISNAWRLQLALIKQLQRSKRQQQRGNVKCTTWIPLLLRLYSSVCPEDTKPQQGGGSEHLAPTRGSRKTRHIWVELEHISSTHTGHHLKHAVQFIDYQVRKASWTSHISDTARSCEKQRSLLKYQTFIKF